MKDQRKFRDAGIELQDTLTDMVFNAGITGTELAQHLGKSEASISCILAPAHEAAFTVKDLRMLMDMVDGEAIARIICSWLGKIPVNLPHGGPRAGSFSREVGELLIAWSGGDLKRLRSELLDVVSMVEGRIVAGVDR